MHCGMVVLQKLQKYIAASQILMTGFQYIQTDTMAGPIYIALKEGIPYCDRHSRLAGLGVFELNLHLLKFNLRSIL